MRCLLLHPEDDPLAAAWGRGPWEQVIDMGIAGPLTYKSWGTALHSEVEPYPSLDSADFAILRQMHSFGLGQLVDERGLDWWDIIWVRWLDQVVDLVLTAKFVASLGSSDEIWVRSEGYARVLDVVAPGRVRRVRAPQRRPKSRLERLRRLTFSQVLEILGDKYDGGYRRRRWAAPAKANCSRPVVLLPSAYGNASRTALSLAASLPEQEFLLIATRRSAWVNPVPQNAKRAWLSSYAVGQQDSREVHGLLLKWERLQRTLRHHPELAMLQRMGCFDSFPAHLREGLAIRNCWVNVLDSEPIASILCADEKNPYTRIPVLLSRKQGIATVSCHHGALDGRYLFSDIAADRFLAKSEMEWDYMVRVCGVSPEHVRRAEGWHTETKTSNRRQEGNVIVFFSEPYEASNCRAREVYADVLPSLARIARKNARELVIKLHPFESLRHRQQLMTRVVASEDHELVSFVTGPITSELFENAWFSVTVSSSAAVDCAAQGVPAFLCLWLDRYGFRYGEQFVKFGAAMALSTAEDVAEIPKRLGGRVHMRTEGHSPNLEPELLKELLFPTAARTSEREEHAERLWA